VNRFRMSLGWEVERLYEGKTGGTGYVDSVAG